MNYSLYNPISIFESNETAAIGVHLDILQVAAEILLRVFFK
jgi:hypothetical protein